MEKRPVITLLIGLLVYTQVFASDYDSFDKAARLKELSPLQIEVTQHEATERPYKNAYWNNKSAGIYVDLLSGEPLFSSTDKYASKTGWPSFKKPIDPQYILKRKDRHLVFFKRIEVRSKFGDAHLGHVFTDGPPPLNLRYCINSAALKFIPKKDMQRLGYGKYLYLFKDKPR